MNSRLLLFWMIWVTTITLLATACSVFESALTAVQPTPTPPTVKTTKNVSYNSSQQLDVYVPSPPGPLPVVVLLHGGGDLKEFYADFSVAIAQKGAVVFTPQWHSSAPPTTLKEPPNVQGFEETACAIRFARAKAAEYGGNPSRLIVVGHSIGGGAGALMALAGDEFKGDCLVNDLPAYPDALVGLDGAYDVLSFFPEDWLKAWPKEFARITPFSYVDRRPIHTNVKFDIVVGDFEDAVQMGKKFHAALKAAGYSSTYTQFPGVSHGGMVDPQQKGILDIIANAIRR